MHLQCAGAFDRGAYAQFGRCSTWRLTGGALVRGQMSYLPKTQRTQRLSLRQTDNRTSPFVVPECCVRSIVQCNYSSFKRGRLSIHLYAFKRAIYFSFIHSF